MADVSGANPTVLDSDAIGSTRRIDYQDRARDGAVRGKYVRDLVAEHGSLDVAIQRFAAKAGTRYHTDGTLPLLDVSAVLLGPHSAYLQARYRRFPNQPNPNLGNTFQAASWRTGTRTARWIQAHSDADGNPTIGEVDGGIEGVTSYPNGPMLGTIDPTNPRDKPRYWLWDTKIQNIYLPFYIESATNPQDEINSRSNKMNDQDLSLDGVTMLKGQLLFSNYTLDKTFIDGNPVYHGTYQFVYSRLGFVEQLPLWRPEVLDPPTPATWVAATSAPYESADIHTLPGIA